MEMVIQEKFLFANGIERTISLIKINTGYVTIVENRTDCKVFEPSLHFDQYLDDANVSYIIAKNTAMGVAKTIEECEHK